MIPVPITELEPYMIETEQDRKYKEVILGELRYINNNVEKITKNVVHTASTKDGVDKDFTDFIILDAIYREAAKKDSPDVFVIFTGDAHFNLAIKYLRELKKKVIIYGVKRSLSNKLKSSANSYVEMPRTNQEQHYYYDAILKSLYILKKRRKMATYYKTIDNVSAHSGVSRERIQAALDDLMSNKYLAEEEKQYRGKKPKVLVVNWDRLEEEGLYVCQGKLPKWRNKEFIL